MTATGTKERGIIFSNHNIPKLMDGTKTQTRRIIKPQPFYSPDHGCWMRPRGRGVYDMNKRRREVFNRDDGKLLSSEKYLLPVSEWLLESSPFKVGMRLWVRERSVLGEEEFTYASDGAEITVPDDVRWGRRVGVVSPLHMPRWASRITLEITEVRVQRLLEINEADSIAEGATIRDPGRPDVGYRCARDAFEVSWRQINGSASWDENPWVFAITFKGIEREVTR